jgi:5-methylcytosine-specific restriction endonuclease McrA
MGLFSFVYCLLMNNLSILYEPVLILNVTFEPLHVSSMRRALALILSGKADIVINGRGVVRSETAVFEAPSVIKLAHMVKRPHPRIHLSKREVLRRDEYRCQYCGTTAGQMTIDHIIPRRLNGPHSWQNLVAACPSCNRRKGGKLLKEARMVLKRRPFEPKPTASYRFSTYVQRHKEWAPFVDGW